MYIEITPENIDERKIQEAVDCLREGGVIIYPTDTIYGLGCDITNEKAVEKVCRIKGIKPRKANLSFICNDLSQISEYTRPFSTAIYKMMKHALPGPYTFILKANNTVPKLFKNNKKTVGIRIPDNPIALRLAEALGNPIVSTSLRKDDEIMEYPTNPYEMYEDYQHDVDMVIDGGPGSLDPSTIIDCTQKPPVVIREGAGSVNI